MLRACKRAVAYRWGRRIHATATSTQLVSSSEKGEAEEGDWRDVGVFWDLENCTVPSGLDPFLVRPNIERALRTSGFLGPISISGFGDIHGYRIHTLEALSESGIDVRHVPNGGKNSSDRALMIDVLFWTMKHSPPAHVLLISGDSDFSMLLHKLRLLNYNVLLAASTSNGVASALVHAANRIWVWPDIAKGEGLLGRVHIPGTPSPFHKDDGSTNKEASVTEPTTDWQQDIRHTLENVKDPQEDVVSGFRNLSEAGWIPPLIVNEVINIVERCPGISLGDISRKLKSVNINVRAFGFASSHQFLLSIPQLETRFTDGLNMKDRIRYHLASTGKCPPTNDVGHLVQVKPLPPDDVRCESAKSSDGAAGNAKRALRCSTDRDDKNSTKKESLDQEKSPSSSSPQSWVSRIFALFKGS